MYRDQLSNYITKSIVVCLAFFATLSPLSAQLSPFQSNLSLYQEGLDLFEREIYGQAIQKVEAFLDAENAVRGFKGNDLYTNAKYIQAVSAFHLKRSDALNLLEGYLKRYPENTKRILVNYYLGKHQFQKKEYRNSIEPLTVSFSSNALQSDLYNEVVFMLGYAYFDIENETQAAFYLDRAANFPGPYQDDARYYYAILKYKQKDYENAYEAMKALSSSEEYAAETRVYLANTLLKLGKTEELFQLADKMVGNSRRKADAGVYYIVAHASYEKGDFANAVKYFDEFRRSKGRLSRTGFFRYAHAQYESGLFKEAIQSFSKVTNQKDTLNQTASYYLGFSYLKTNDPNGARLAFKRASETFPGENRAVSQDALYQYAKVSYATKYYDDALSAMRRLEKEFPNSPHRNEIKSLMGETLLLNNNYEETIAYLKEGNTNTPRAQKALQQANYYYGLQLYEAESYGQSATYLKQAAASSSDAKIAQDAKFWGAEAAFRGGDLGKALQEYSAFQKSRNAKSSKYYKAAGYGKAWTYFKQKKYTQAAKEFDTFINGDGPKSSKRIMVDAYLRAGDSYFMGRNYNKANGYYSRVVEANISQQDYAYYQMAEGFYRQSKYTNSVRAFDRLITAYPSSDLHDNALDRISEIYATWLKDYAQASYYGKQLVQKYPNSPLAAAAYNRIAFASYNAGNEREAVKYFKKVLSDYSMDKANSQIALDNLSVMVTAAEFDRILANYRNKNPELNENVADLTFNTGRDRFFEESYQSAINQFSIYIKDYSTGRHYYEARVLRARAYKATGQRNKALEDYKQVYSATVRNPFSSTALMEAAQLEYELGRYDASLKLYQELVKTADNAQNRILAKFGVATILKDHKNDYSGAITILQQIENSSDAELYEVNTAKAERGDCEHLNGNIEKAHTIFKALEKDNDDEFGARGQFGIVRYWHAKDEHDKAIDATFYFNDNYPTYNYWKARTFLVLAETYYKMGNIFQAKGTLESLAGESRFPDVQEMAKKRRAEIVQEENQSIAPVSGN